MSLADKKNEGHIQLDNMENYRPLAEAMVEETASTNPAKYNIQLNN